MMLLLPLLFLLLMGDFPRMDDSIRFVLPRVGRRTWYLGQLLFSFLASVTILGGFCMFTTIWCIGRLSWNHGMWSDAVTKYYQEVQSDFKFNLITGEIYNQVTPIYAFLHSVFLVLALMLALSALLLLFGVLQKKVAGLTICGFWVAIGNGLAVFQSEPFMWLFPIANTQIRLRYGVLFREEQMPLWGSYLYFVVVLFGAIVLGWYFGCNRRRV